ncbi:hypothetical protein PRIPAC_87967 [Pristionchus pacificus]|nr:hypothetical protein PRIPAC_87967 [Pristionchus pacificus]
MEPIEGLSAAVIHRKSVIHILQIAGESTTTVERTSLNNIFIKIPHSPDYEASFSHDSSPFFYLTNGISLFTINLETLTVLPTLKIGKIPFRYITGVHNGVITLMDDENQWRLLSALLPEGYFQDNGKPTNNDSLMSKFMGLFIKNDSVSSRTSQDWLNGKIVEEESSYIRDQETPRKSIAKQYQEEIKKKLMQIKMDSQRQQKSTEYASKFVKEFNYIRIRGKGGFGCVFEVTNKLDIFEYAVKRIAVSKNNLDENLKEVCIMATLDHPGIVRYNHTWLEEPPAGWQNCSDFDNLDGMQSYFNDDDVFIYIQMKLYKNSLDEWLDANQTESSRDQSRIKSWFREIVTAVQYLHDNNIIHSDLKPANILLDDKEHVKLCDLGIATDRNIENGVEVTITRSPKCSPIYSSPEQLCMFTRFSSKTDVFALGLIFAELCLVMTTDDRLSSDD